MRSFTTPYTLHPVPLSSRGFTLIELIVSIAIFAMMTALVVAKYGTFNQNTLVTNLAYDIALTIRTAQTYGLSVKSSDASANSFDAAYGVDFDLTGSNSNRFVFFADKDLNGAYGGLDTVISTYTLSHGAKVTKICLGSSSNKCIAGGLITVGQVDVTFHRPNPDAAFYCVTGCTIPGPVSTPQMTITIVSSDGTNSQMVIIRKNGQISVGD
jgi:prepilin-type N-terminal cleavage/methylation domain-containing protein